MSTPMEPLAKDRRRQVSCEGEAARRFERLHSTSLLGFDRSSCLPLQFPYLTCKRCVDACPAGVLHRADDALRLEDGCLHCGRCVAACPTGALRASGFETGKPARDTVYLDCWKVPPEKSPAAAVRVPCLGGLTQSQWLALTVKSNGHGVVALDRGWCARCSAGAGETHPAATALTETRSLLHAISLPETQQPRLEPRPLPPERMPRQIPATDPAKGLGRRRFLQDLAREVTAAAVEMRGHEPEPPEKRRRLGRPGALRARERERQLAWLALLARRRGSEMPAAVLPVVAIGAGCRNHRVCAALCPTGALRAYDAEGESGVAFDAYQCIACGHCERACPEHAIRFSAHGEAAAAPERVLSTHQRRECVDCGLPFADGIEARAAGQGWPGGGFADPSRADRCPACRKSRALVKQAFDQLFATRG